MDRFYKQPKYYRDFRCIGGECPKNCCYGWRIDWTDEEYTRLIRADLPQNLRAVCETSFAPNNYYGVDQKFYMIRFSEDGRCPFLERETGLCTIQKNLGERYLSTTCITYPRRIFKRDNVYFRSCNTSCVHIIEMLLKDSKATVLETFIAHDIKDIKPHSLKYDTIEDIQALPYLKYRMKILEFYSNLFNSGMSIENTIILGALVAKQISDCDATEDMINNILTKYKKHDNSMLLQSLEGITPKYNTKFMISNSIYNKFLKNNSIDVDFSALNYNNEFQIENYLIGKKKFDDIFEHEHWFLNNIAANLFYELFMHMDIGLISFFELYMVFSSYYSLIQTMSASIGYSSENIKREFIISLAGISRSLSHGAHRAVEVLGYMKELGFVSPAHIAILVK